MSLLGALTTGSSGVTAFGRAMTVVGSNIANVNTFGYKAAHVSFEDVLSSDFPQGTGPTKVSQGVGIASINQNFTQGAFEQTELQSDMAINGEGFFTVQDQFGRRYYTRAGQFTYDKSGQLSTDRGLNVLTKDVDPITKEAVGLPKPLKVLGTIDPPVPTGDGRMDSGIKVAANLDAGAAVLDTPFDPTNVKSNMYNYSTTTTVYDRSGADHTATIVYRKRPDIPEQVDPNSGQVIPAIRNQWEWYTLFEGEEVGQRPGQMVAVGGGFLQFTDDGRLVQSTGGQFIAQPGGVDPNTGQPLPSGPPILQPAPVNPDTGKPQITVDFGSDAPQVIGISLGMGSNPDDPNDERTGLEGLTQFASPNSIIGVDADGHPSGTLEGIVVESSGVVMGRFDSGYMRPMGKIVLTKFDNPQKLLKQGDNLFQTSPHSGKAILGEPGVGAFGEIRSQTLEQSNVDLAREFVKMVETQRAFQANAKTVTTADEMIQEMVNLKR
ncbi:MAG: flagellar hook protein FlgE [SAR324 cluster bacterium]|nr:flagellar hook protein FlgE [SAR324 cluster bacterium]